MGAENARRIAPALIALMVILPPTVFAAPVSESTEVEEYHEGGCYYNFQHYGEGDRIMTNEPCLNCTCHNRMLMCYLRVCPFTKAIGQDCTVEKRGDQCCPIITCPDVPVDLLTSTTSSPIDSTEVGHHDNFGCSIDNKFYSDGARVPSNPDKPCELCYCIRNMTSCVMQECTLHVEGCMPVYHKGVCCPVRYACDYAEEEGPLMLDDLTTTVRPTPGFILTTTMAPGASMECTYNDLVFGDGALIATDKDCEHCYCMKGDIVCAVQECGTPMENEGKNCTALPAREGQCCPDSYECDESESVTTDISPSDIVTTADKEMPDHRTPVDDEEVTEKQILTTHSQSDLVTQIRDNKGENEIIDDDIIKEIFTTKSPQHRDDTPDESYPTVKDETEATQKTTVKDSTESDDEIQEHVTEIYKPDKIDSDEHIKSDDSTELPDKITKHHDEDEYHHTEPIIESSTKAHPLDDMFEGSGHVDHASTPAHDDVDVTKHDDDESPFENDEVILIQTTQKSVDEHHASPTTVKTLHDEDEKEDHTPVYESSGADELPEDDGLTTPASVHEIRYETTDGVGVTPTKDASHIDQHTTEDDDKIIFKDDDDKHDFTISEKEHSTASPTAAYDDEHHTKSDDVTKKTTAKSEDDDVATKYDTETTDVEQDKEEIEKTTHAAIVTSPPRDDHETTISDLEEEIDEHDVTTSHDEIFVPPRIPGEGDCLLNGVSYRNNTAVATTNRCQISCKCINSIVRCENVNCSPPPPNMLNCQPVYHGKETCCPTYTCEHQEHVTIEAGNQMHDDKSDVTTETPIQRTESYPDQKQEQHTISPTEKQHGDEVSEEPIIPIVYLPDCGPEGCFFDTTKPGQELKTTTDEIDQLAFAHTTIRPSVGVEFDQKTESPIVDDAEKKTDAPSYHVIDHDDEQVKITVGPISDDDKDQTKLPQEDLHEFTTKPAHDHKEADESTEDYAKSTAIDDDKHIDTSTPVSDDKHDDTTQVDDDKHKDIESSTPIKSDVETSTVHEVHDDTEGSTASDDEIKQSITEIYGRQSTESPDSTHVGQEDKFGEDKVQDVGPEQETPSDDVTTTEKHIPHKDDEHIPASDDEDKITTVSEDERIDYTTESFAHHDDKHPDSDEHEIIDKPSSESTAPSDDSTEMPHTTQKQDDLIPSKSSDEGEMMKMDTTISPADDEFRTTLLTDEKEADKHTTVSDDISTNIVDDRTESSTEMKIVSKSTESFTTVSSIDKTTISIDDVNKIGVSVLPTDVVDEDCPPSGCAPKVSEHGEDDITTEGSIIKSDCSGQECEIKPHVPVVHEDKKPACDEHGCVGDDQQNIIGDDIDKSECKGTDCITETKPHVPDHDVKDHTEPAEIETESPISSDEDVTQSIVDTTEIVIDHKVPDDKVHHEDKTEEPSADNEINVHQTDKPEVIVPSADCKGEKCVGGEIESTELPVRSDIEPGCESPDCAEEGGKPSDDAVTTEKIFDITDDLSNEVFDDQHPGKFPDASKPGVTDVFDHSTERIKPDVDIKQSEDDETIDHTTIKSDEIPEKVCLGNRCAFGPEDDDTTQTPVTEITEKSIVDDHFDEHEVEHTQRPVIQDEVVTTKDTHGIPDHSVEMDKTTIAPRVGDEVPTSIADKESTEGPVRPEHDKESTERPEEADDHTTASPIEDSSHTYLPPKSDTTLPTGELTTVPYIYQETETPLIYDTDVKSTTVTTRVSSDDDDGEVAHVSEVFLDHSTESPIYHPHYTIRDHTIKEVIKTSTESIEHETPSLSEGTETPKESDVTEHTPSSDIEKDVTKPSDEETRDEITQQKDDITKLPHSDDEFTTVKAKDEFEQDAQYTTVSSADEIVTDITTKSDRTTQKSVIDSHDEKEDQEVIDIHKDSHTEGPSDEYTTHDYTTVIQDEKTPEDDHIDEDKPSHTEEPSSEYTTPESITSVKDHEKEPEHDMESTEIPIKQHTTLEPVSSTKDEKEPDHGHIDTLETTDEPSQDYTTHEPVIEDGKVTEHDVADDEKDRFTEGPHDDGITLRPVIPVDDKKESEQDQIDVHGDIQTDRPSDEITTLKSIIEDDGEKEPDHEIKEPSDDHTEGPKEPEPVDVHQDVQTEGPSDDYTTIKSIAGDVDEKEPDHGHIDVHQDVHTERPTYDHTTVITGVEDEEDKEPDHGHVDVHQDVQTEGPIDDYTTVVSRVGDEDEKEQDHGHIDAHQDTKTEQPSDYTTHKTVDEDHEPEQDEKSTTAVPESGVKDGEKVPDHDQIDDDITEPVEDHTPAHDQIDDDSTSPTEEPKEDHTPQISTTDDEQKPEHDKIDVDKAVVTEKPIEKDVTVPESSDDETKTDKPVYHTDKPDISEIPIKTEAPSDDDQHVTIPTIEDHVETKKPIEYPHVTEIPHVDDEQETESPKPVHKTERPTTTDEHATEYATKSPVDHYPTVVYESDQQTEKTKLESDDHIKETDKPDEDVFTIKDIPDQEVTEPTIVQTDDKVTLADRVADEDSQEEKDKVPEQDFVTKKPHVVSGEQSTQKTDKPQEDHVTMEPHTVVDEVTDLYTKSTQEQGTDKPHAPVEKDDELDVTTPHSYTQIHEYITEHTKAPVHDDSDEDKSSEEDTDEPLVHADVTKIPDHGISEDDKSTEKGTETPVYSDVTKIPEHVPAHDGSDEDKSSEEDTDEPLVHSDVTKIPEQVPSHDVSEDDTEKPLVHTDVTKIPDHDISDDEKSTDEGTETTSVHSDVTKIPEHIPTHDISEEDTETPLVHSGVTKVPEHVPTHAISDDTSSEEDKSSEEDAEKPLDHSGVTKVPDHTTSHDSSEEDKSSEEDTETPIVHADVTKVPDHDVSEDDKLSEGTETPSVHSDVTKIPDHFPSHDIVEDDKPSEGADEETKIPEDGNRTTVIYDSDIAHETEAPSHVDEGVTDEIKDAIEHITTDKPKHDVSEPIDITTEIVQSHDGITESYEKKTDKPEIVQDVTEPEKIADEIPTTVPSVDDEIKPTTAVVHDVPEESDEKGTTEIYEPDVHLDQTQSNINDAFNDTKPEIVEHSTPSILSSRQPDFTTKHSIISSTTKSPHHETPDYLFPGHDDQHQVPQAPEFPGSSYGSPAGGDDHDYDEEDQDFGPGTCRYGGKVYVSAQQIPRDDPCDFCFCFRSDIICLQQSCPPPIQHCHEEPIQGFCCPRYECPVSMATVLNVTTTTTTTTTTLPPHFLSHPYKGAAQRRGCQIQGQAYRVGEVVRSASGPCLTCTCGGDGQMKCDPKVCTPEPMLRQMIAVAATSRRR